MRWAHSKHRTDEKFIKNLSENPVLSGATVTKIHSHHNGATDRRKLKTKVRGVPSSNMVI
jgi:hypothetical protein